MTNEGQETVDDNGVRSDGRTGKKEILNEGTKKSNCKESGAGKVGYVYFIATHDSAFVKIGFSVNIHRRFDHFEILWPALRLIGYMPGSRQTESWLHEKFSPFRENGEWFRYCEEVRQFVAVLGLIELQSKPAHEPNREPEPHLKLDGRGEAAKLLQSLRKTRAGGRPPVLRKCKFCKQGFSARELRAHVPICPARQAKKAGK